MSMLAEARRKANYVLNPKNTHWSADNSKFGLRLMEKMGWTEGNGLGAKEQGSTEHIKVQVRSDNRGVGFKDRPEDDLVHQSEFSDLLQQLASDTPPLEGSGDESKSTVITSLEEKSEKSRSRVHYKKFTRGKDLSRYSEKDLASILGRPAPVKKSTTGEEKKESTFESDVVTIGGGNMLDYFRKKMAGFRSEENSGDASRSEEICADKGRRELNGTENNVAKTDGVKKGKKSKGASKDVDDSTFKAELEGVENTYAETKKERKRRRKAEEALNISEQLVDMKNSNNVKDENSMNFKLNLLSTSEGSDDAEKDTAGAAETKKEKKRRRKAEKALKIFEQQAVVEDSANLTSKQKFKSASDQRKQDEEGYKTLDTEAHANDKKEKKRKRKVERALENSRGRTELEITTISAESSSNPISKRVSKSELEESVLADEEKSEDRSVKNEMEITEGNNADDICSKEMKRKKSQGSRKESDQGAIELEFKNDFAYSSKIKSKKSKRKLKDEVNVELIPGIAAKEGKNREGKREFLGNLENSVDDAEQEFKKENKHKRRKTNQGVEIDLKTENQNQKVQSGGKFTGFNGQPNAGNHMPITMKVNEPEVFWDARSKKAKNKGKLHKLPESSEHVPLVGDSNEEVGCSVEIKKDRTLEKMGRQTSDSKTFENTTGVKSIECAVKERKEKRRKQKNREALCSEMLEETTCVLSEEVECFVEAKKERKRKRKDRNPPGSETIEEISDVCKEDAVCAAELGKEKKHEKEDKFIASTIEQITDENGTLTEEIIIKGFKNIAKAVDNTILRPLEEQNDVVRAENIDVVSTELILQRNVADTKLHVTGSLKTGVDVLALILGEQISSSTSTTVVEDVTQNNCSGITEKEDAPKKPVPIVKLNGKVYLNGICNFDLSHPEINNVEAKKIPLHLRQQVKFLPIPGTNVDEFGYIGLNFNK